jgi:hypothetical protein
MFLGHRRIINDNVLSLSIRTALGSLPRDQGHLTMQKLTALNRTLVALGLVAALTLPSASFSQSVSAADIAKLQESLQAMRDAYEQRINALEQKITTLQQQNAPAAGTHLCSAIHRT